MKRFDNPLDHVRVAAPCKVDWEKMIGSERVRFCGQCNLNVYNLSSMSKTEAESLIVQTEGRLCVRYYRRTDGSVMTDNCPVGLRALRRRLGGIAKGVSAAVFSFFAGFGVSEVQRSLLTPHVMGVMAEVGKLPVRDYPEVDISTAEPKVMGELIRIQDPAGRRARRHTDKVRTESTR